MGKTSFDPLKMERLVRKDSFLEWVVNDLISRSHTKEKALELVFNGYVVEDSVMESKYEQA